MGATAMFKVFLESMDVANMISDAVQFFLQKSHISCKYEHFQIQINIYQLEFQVQYI
jgi:hypothetical protein